MKQTSLSQPIALRGQPAQPSSQSTISRLRGVPKGRGSRKTRTGDCTDYLADGGTGQAAMWPNAHCKGHNFICEGDGVFALCANHDAVRVHQVGDSTAFALAQYRYASEHRAFLAGFDTAWPVRLPRWSSSGQSRPDAVTRFDTEDHPLDSQAWARQGQDPTTDWMES